MTRILLVEDAPDTRALVARALADYRVESVGTLLDAERLLKQERFDLMLLDIGLPDGDGLKFLSRQSAEPQERRVPTLVVSAHDDVPSKVMAFSLGVEDFVTKPFDPSELRARVRAKLRKHEEEKARGDVVTIGELTLNASEHRAERRDAQGRTRPVEFTAKEFQLLLFLAKRPETVVSRETILDGLWGRDANVVDRAIDTHISHIRRKLGSESRVSIKAVPGEGYRLSVAAPSRPRLEVVRETEKT